MARASEDAAAKPDPERPGVQFPRMLTSAKVKEILNVEMPTIWVGAASGALVERVDSGKREPLTSQDAS